MMLAYGTRRNPRPPSLPTNPMIPTFTRRFVPALLLALGAATAGAQSATTSRAIDRANMDSTCLACQDFYEYANGGWQSRATIPAAYAVWGSFQQLSDKNEAVVRDILEDAAKRAPTAKPKSNLWKIGTFYGTCMDSTRIEALGRTPLQPTLDAIAAITSREQLGDSFGDLDQRAGLAPFGIGTAQDPKSSTDVIAQAGQGGLGMPERDYYLRTDEKSKALRDKYVDHITRTFMLIGENEADAKADAGRVMALETRLAAGSMPRVAMRDPNAVYHKMSLAEFQAIAPHVNMTRYLEQVGAKRVSVVNVRQPDFFRTLDTLVATVPLEDWKAYLRWRAASKGAAALGSAFVNQAFSWQQNLTGAKELRPRWKRCVDATNAVLGEAVGEVYVSRTFTPAAKARALAMVNNLRDALRERIGQLGWMSDTTKRQALVKLDAFTRKIGYPDKWRDYTALQVKPGAYAQNLQAANRWATARDWAKLGKPVDRTEWAMTPHMVNAYYNPVLNEIVFPAGILQSPFYDPNADDAVNYGGMGAVIGHEMTHGFDDQGRQFDASGNLRDWWTGQDAAAYKARAQLVSDQFDRYTVIDTATHVNGKLTLGENIADLGGLTIAYAAFQKSLAGKPRPPRIDGFTPEQRFFLSWAQVWREASRAEAQRVQVNTNPHAPARWRVNGPLSNMPEFAKAFSCSPGDPMVRADSIRAQIW
jgi:putative endopeptidase